MTKNAEFEARIARIQSKSAPPPLPQADTSDRICLHAPPREGVPRPLILASVGLVCLAGAFAFVWDDLAYLFPAPQDGREVTALEAALRDTLSEDEIRAMNDNPDLDGLSEMQKIIQSN